MNTLRATIIVCAAFFAIDAFSFGHVDELKIRKQVLNMIAFGIAECVEDPVCKSDNLDDLEDDTTRAARFVFACRDVPKCKHSSIANFTAKCEQDDACTEAVAYRVKFEIEIFEECLLNPECKDAIMSCRTDSACQEDLQSCMADPRSSNPSCEITREIYPESLLEKLIDQDS